MKAYSRKILFSNSILDFTTIAMFQIIFLIQSSIFYLLRQNPSFSLTTEYVSGKLPIYLINIVITLFVASFSQEILHLLSTRKISSLFATASSGIIFAKVEFLSFCFEKICNQSDVINMVGPMVFINLVAVVLIIKKKTEKRSSAIKSKWALGLSTGMFGAIIYFSRWSPLDSLIYTPIFMTYLVITLGLFFTLGILQDNFRYWKEKRSLKNKVTVFIATIWFLYCITGTIY